MAIQVLKEGKLPSNQKYKVSCGTCKAEFTFLRSDASTHSHRNEVYVCVNCPTCGKQVCADEPDYLKD